MHLLSLQDIVQTAAAAMRDGRGKAGRLGDCQEEEVLRHVLATRDVDTRISTKHGFEGESCGRFKGTERKATALLRTNAKSSRTGDRLEEKMLRQVMAESAKEADALVSANYGFEQEIGDSEDRALGENPQDQRSARHAASDAAIARQQQH
jgi:hypothetical protein